MYATARATDLTVVPYKHPRPLYPNEAIDIDLVLGHGRDGRASTTSGYFEQYR